MEQAEAVAAHVHGALLLLAAGIYAAFQTAFPGVAAVRVLLFVLLAADCIWMLAVTRSLRHGRNIESS
ncbi:MAG: hypothetical protein ACLTCB_02830 [Merdibacter sp.]